MTYTPTRAPERPLDTFESALLSELRGIVAERARTVPASATAPAAGSADRPARRHVIARPRLVAAAALVAAGAAALTVGPLGGTPAYALSQAANGDITVTVNELTGADELERDLAAYGISSDVTYLPAGKMCAPGRYAEGGRGAGRFEASASAAGGNTITIAKGSVKSGQTLVLSSMWQGPSTWALGAGIADGPVGACMPVDADLPDAPGLDGTPAGPGSGGSGSS